MIGGKFASSVNFRPWELPRITLPPRTGTGDSRATTTLQKIEENSAAAEDHPQIEELKRLLRLRIADLEFVGAAVQRNNTQDNHPDAVQLDAIEDAPEAA